MLKPRRSVSVTPNNSAKQLSQSHTPTPKTPFTKLSSLPVKSVQLYNWWLVPADGEGLAVGGFALRNRSLGVRTFKSAAIVKRHDRITLETADGIMVTVNGSINRSRTHLNGFPLEVCNDFLLGFPSYWEEYANQCCGKESVGKGVPTRNFVEDNMSSGSRASTSQPFPLHEIHVTRIRDFLVSPPKAAGNGSPAQELVDGVLQKCGYSIVQDEYANKRKKTKAYTPSRSIVTRSMSRMKNTVSKQEESLASKSSVADKNSAELLTPKATWKQSQGVGTESGSRNCQETTFPEQDKKKQVVGNPDKSAIRRSSRLKNQKKTISMAQPHF